MYITDTDNMILRFAEKYGSISINQAYKLFYPNQVYGNVSAGKHLNKLVKYEKLNVYRDISGKINIYYMNKKLRYHDLLVLDYFVELIHSGADIIHFKQNQEWMISPENKKARYITDGFCCYKIGEKIIFNIIEVIRTNGIDKEKYINLFESNEPQQYSDYIYKKIGGTETITDFPKLIVIDNVQHMDDYLYINDQIEVKQLNFKLNNFSSIFL